MINKNVTRVLVSGCFDLLHSGHIEFLKTAASYGDELYVVVGTDKNLKLLKDIIPTYNQYERVFILNSLKCVTNATIAKGSGKLDFLTELEEIKPQTFVVNYDGHSIEKQRVCEEKGIKYIVLKRDPHEGLPVRSSTEMRSRQSGIPNRISIAGGWLDQPYVSEKYPGPNLTISIEPTYTFNFRSGIASSTRNNAIKLWGNFLPEGDPIHLAKVLFCFDNPPGTPKEEVAGAQDSIGIVVPGLVYSFYNGKYWPEKILQEKSEEILAWLEDKIYLIELKPREDNYNVFIGSQINLENVKKLSDASEKCYNAILNKDFNLFAEAFLESFEAQTNLFPATFPDWIKPIIEEYKSQGMKGWKLSGAGGGGYLVAVSEIPLKNAIRVKIRRSQHGP